MGSRLGLSRDTNLSAAFRELKLQGQRRASYQACFLLAGSWTRSKTRTWSWTGVCVCVCTCHFLDGHLAEVTADVRQQVAPWVSDLVEQLLSHGAEGHQTASLWRFGENKGAVAGTLDHRESHIVPGTRTHPTAALRSLCGHLLSFQCGLNS